ncbi:MAG: diguanylate cyclase [Gallionella sp.]|jgi:diguanylate cyclase (GGDEF)-like protein
MMRKTCGIRTQVIWLTLVPLLTMVIGLEAFFLHDRYVDLNNELVSNGQLIASQLAASSEYGVFSNNNSYLNGIAESALQRRDVRAVVVLNASSKILAASGDSPDTLVRSFSVDKLLKLVNQQVPLFDNGHTLLMYQPILLTQLALDDIESAPAIRQAGAVIIEMSWDETRRLKFKLLWYTLCVTTIFLLVTLYLVHIASRRIIEPITQLSEAIQAIGAGHLETRMAVPVRVTELGALANGINQMSEQLLHERNILQSRIDEATHQLRNLAFYDTLTLLPNRRLLNDRLTQAFANSKRSGRYGALMFLDLDNFKPINDQFGHAVGDLLLIEAAQRISSCLREVDTVARFGGDEFVVMLSELDVDLAESISLARGVAEKIRLKLSEPYNLIYRPADQPELKVEHCCTASIGVVPFLNHEASQEEIMSRADAAMYLSKKLGRNQIYIYQHADAELALKLPDA